MRRGRSLGARLILLFVVLALAMTVTFVAGMQTAMRHGWADFARPLINDYADTLAAEIGTPPSIEKAQALTRRLPLRIRIEGPVVNWASHPRDPDRERRHREDARDGARGDDGSGGPRADRGRPGRADNPWRPTRVLADGHRISFGLASLPRDDEDASPEDRPRRIGFMTLAALLLFTALAYIVVRHWLRPLRDIRTGAIRYGAGDFAHPIPRRGRGRDELGELAGQINTMASSLRDMLDAKRQLLLAISHELRSPLTRARLNAELIADGPERDALLRDLSEIRDLITDLLESERLAGGHAALHTEPGDVAALIAEVLASHFQGRAVETRIEPRLPAIAMDPARIRLLLRNLIDNALRHTPRDAPPPELSARLDAAGLVLSVRDHGPGAPDEVLARLGEAFYRPDSARQRATGGVGLGLYLCRLVAEAHGGCLTIRNASPGLETSVVLPIVAAAIGAAAIGPAAA